MTSRQVSMAESGDGNGPTLSSSDSERIERCGARWRLDGEEVEWVVAVALAELIREGNSHAWQGPMMAAEYLYC